MAVKVPYCTRWVQAFPTEAWGCKQSTRGRTGAIDSHPRDDVTGDQSLCLKPISSHLHVFCTLRFSHTVSEKIAVDLNRLWVYNIKGRISRQAKFYGKTLGRQVTLTPRA